MAGSVFRICQELNLFFATACRRSTDSPNGGALGGDLGERGQLNRLLRRYRVSAKPIQNSGSIERKLGICNITNTIEYYLYNYSRPNQIHAASTPQCTAHSFP